VLVSPLNKKKNQVLFPTFQSNKDLFFRALSKLVSLKTISGSLSHTEECRRGATFLKNILKELGATESLLIPNPINGRNPIVLGKFQTKSSKAKSLLFYGHYDIITAMTGSQEWSSEPYTLSGRDGFYYGRGVSDNKGPVLAAMFAVSDLLKKGVDVNITFLIEGEEESGSKGFVESVKAKKVYFLEVCANIGSHRSC
jgi:di- and tripeptidase